MVAVVRSPDKADALREFGCELVKGDLGVVSTDVLSGCGAAVHCAAVYQVGVTSEQAVEMRKINVGGTAGVLDAAIEAGVGRIVYVSTVNTFGDTRGAVVDEAYERPANAFVSAYDETKWEARRAARERGEQGAPILIAMPGLVYGPGDTSQIGGAGAGRDGRKTALRRLPYTRDERGARRRRRRGDRAHARTGNGR